jgi:undecaprenyl-diphosphatase
MIEGLMQLDLIVFDMINGVKSVVLDQIMIWLSDKYIWIPLYAFLIYKLVKKYGRQFWLPLVCVLLTFAFTDQFTASFMKPFFQRLRPCHDESISDIVVVVTRCGGKYGFASSHAANTMGLAFIYFMLFKEQKMFGYSLIIWSFFVGYSRIHLGVHYPGDVLVGFIVGILAAYFFFKSFLKAQAVLNSSG